MLSEKPLSELLSEKDGENDRRIREESGQCPLISPFKRPLLHPIFRPALRSVYHSKFRNQHSRDKLYAWYNQVHQNSKLDYVLRDLKTCYGNTRVAVAGTPEGEALVFLHGWSGNGMLWELTGSLHKLASRYRIFLVDVIGQPNNSSLQSPPIRGNGYGLWLSDVLDQLALKEATGIGMSFGAFLWVKAAQIIPERIKRVVFLGPAGFTNLSLTPRTAIAFGRAILKPNDGNIEHFVRTNILGPNDQFSPSTRQKIVEMFQGSFEGFKPGAQLPYVFAQRELAALRFPSLFLCGEKDALFNAQNVLNRAQKHVPGLVKAEILPGLGHALGNSDLVVARMERFLTKGN